MKRLFAGLSICTMVLTACHTAQTQQQQQPTVVVVAPDELSRDPSQPIPSPITPGTVPAQPAEASQPAQPLTGDTIFVSKPAASSPRKLTYNSCNVDGKYIAMTFDDGPSPEQTPKLLDMLKQRGLKATFYVVGTNAAAYPEIVKRIVDEGHEIANHSWNHPTLTKLSAAGVKSQLDRTSDAIFNACGQRPATMRHPYGATNSSLNAKINDQFGMKVILWSVDPLDWKYRNASRVATQLIQGAKPGAIMLAHDIHPSTVAAMPQVFDTLTQQDYKFVTVSELISMDRPPQLVEKTAPAPKPAPGAVTAPAEAPVVKP